MTHTAKANVNIALIKYWGKKDIEWNLPLTSSISLTLDAFYTKTTVTYDPTLTADILLIDDETITGGEYLRVTKYMDKLRKLYSIPFYAKITSYNFVPKKAGLASSSSAFAALAYAATKAYGLNLDSKELSSLARLGSGSASRSIYGGLVLWHEGHDHMSSYAEHLTHMDDLAVIVCLIDETPKKVNSTDAMNRLNEYPDLKELWILSTQDALNDMKEAIIENDFDKMGSIAESHASLMHYIIQETGVSYLTDQSFKVMDLTEKIRNEGIPVYYTMDAGANVKILTKKEYVETIKARYEKLSKVIVSYTGMGVSSL